MARGTKEVEPINYYPINEAAARRAKEMNSFYDYKEGSATEEYRSIVDKAAALAERQKARVDPMYHEKIRPSAGYLRQKVGREHEPGLCH